MDKMSVAGRESRGGQAFVEWAVRLCHPGRLEEAPIRS